MVPRPTAHLRSAYYNTTVSLRVGYCRTRAPEHAACPTYDRRVTMYCFEKVFCVAVSIIRLTDARYCALIANGRIGLGQLFRRERLLPAFTLFAAERIPATEDPHSGGFWRSYALRAPGISCEIYERFPASLFDLWPASCRPGLSPASCEAATDAAAAALRDAHLGTDVP